VYKRGVGRRIPPPPPPGKPAPRAKKGAAPDVFTSLTTPVASSRDFGQIALSMSKGHIRVLDTEAGMLGLRRSQLLELLFLNDLGHRSIVRMEIAPRYELSRSELGETERFLWYVRPEVKKLVEEHCLKLGLKPSAWAVTALNRWAGLAA
jgi:hypothetical protein